MVVDGADPVAVTAAVQAALASAYAFAVMDFGEPVTLDGVYAVMQSVSGVQAVDIQQLYRLDTGPSSNEPEWRLLAALPTIQPDGIGEPGRNPHAGRRAAANRDDDMSATRTTLYDLLPQVLRMRDSAAAVVTPGLLAPDDRANLESLQTIVAAGGTLTAAQQTELMELTAAASGGPLASLIAIFEEQVLDLRENLDQLYDDHFIETCADWVAPYIGDLISYRPLHGVAPEVASPRAEVAHTIGYRRRKGTITVIEQLARDVTGWNATAVEFFQRLVVTQYMNHIRRECLASPDLRDWRKLERVGGGAFDRVMRTFEARKVASGRGRYNIPNVGVYLWRLDPYSRTRSPAAMVDATRGRFHPLGIDSALVTLPKTETNVLSLATPLNVPEPITRRDFAERTADYYTGADKVTKSLRLYVGPPNALVAIDPSLVVSCNLADSGTGWAHAPPAGKYAIDVALGRFALPAAPPAGSIVALDFHYAFSAPIGGGEYNRQTSSLGAATPPKLVRVPTDAATISAALAALGGAGVVEIEDSGRYAETLAISVATNATIELRAANGRRPTVWLGAPMELSGAAGRRFQSTGSCSPAPTCMSGPAPPMRSPS